MTARTGKAKQTKTAKVMNHDPLADLSADLDEMTESAVQDAEASEVVQETVSIDVVNEQTHSVDQEDAVDAVVMQNAEVESEGSASPADAAEVESMADQSVVDLGTSLTIMDAGEMHQRLVGLCDAGGKVELIAGTVDQVDGAGVQLLAAFVKEATQLQVEIEWKSISDALVEAVDTLGLRDAMLFAAAK